jgi:hypothetical protein
MMSFILENIIETQQIESKKTTLKTNSQLRYPSYFSSELKPRMSLNDYIDRLASYLHISDSCFLLALIYIDRLTDGKSEVKIDAFSIHRLCAVSLILAMKFNDDVILHKNKFISHVVGIPAKELQFLEFKFMELMDFKLFVHPLDFKKYCRFFISNWLSASENSSKYLLTSQIKEDPTLISITKELLQTHYKNFGFC